MKRPVANLAAVAVDVAKGRIGAVVESDQATDQGSLFGAAFAEFSSQALRQFRLCYRLAVAVEDLEVPGQQVAQQPIGHAVAIRLGPTMQTNGSGVIALEPV